MKRIILSLLLAVIAVTTFGQVGTISVTVVSSEPVTGLTTIDYEFTGIEGRTYTLTVEVNFDDGAGYQTIPIEDLSEDISNVSGNGATFSGTIEWDGADSFDNLYHEQTKIKITATPVFQCGENVTFTYGDSEVTYGIISKTYNEGESDEYTLCWMDRNLGASQVATSSTDEDAYGDLFQWGRLDDGHQDRASTVTSTLSTTDVPGHGEFITNESSPNDWRSGQNDALWQGEDGINNPCPPGWRVPTYVELNDERSSWASNNSMGAFASPLKLPMAGYRSSSYGSLSNVGSGGDYWSSTVDVSYSRSLYFGSGSAYVYSGSRAFGFSVRCLKD